ncbi:hypothetical protein BJ944DRAFT_156163 [Cunninghamella echinulata]|nr:hypothetical protein BJ944DRAFT_156163 [Cunninghamella echinulata]
MFSCFGKRPCVFCDVTTEAGFKIIHESEDLIAFHDRSPGGKLHLLVIPRRHIGTIKDVGENELPLIQKMIGLGKQLLKENGFDPDDKQKVR